MSAYNVSRQTRLAQALGVLEPEHQGLVPAVYPATTYLRDADNGYSRGRVYSRADNPTHEPVERLLASLDEGAAAMLFSSGMAAAVAVFQTLRPGARVVAPTVMYWALRNWLREFCEQWQLELELVDTSDLTEVQSALSRPTDIVWLEVPANPLWHLCDIAAISELARAAGARVVVDATVATPVLCRPLTWGADLVMHSATKYLNGHSDVVAGALVTRSADDWWQALLQQRKAGGAVLGPADASQLLRGMRTLQLRVQQASSSALYLAQALSQEPGVHEVLYPGLPDHPQHQLAVRLLPDGFGGMLSIRLAGGARHAIGTAARTRLWHRATSLGGVESLLEHRASIEGPGSPVPDDLLRLSVGIEEPAELLADLREAIAAAWENR